MVNNVALNCGSMRPELQFGKKINAKLAFGSEKIKEPEDGFEAEKKADGEEEINEQAAKPERKFSIKNAGSNFWQGVTSPIRQMIDNPKIAGAAVAGGFVLKKVVKDYPRVGLFSLAGTVGIAAYNVGKGLYNLVKAETPKAKENSFYDIGQGTIYGTMALLPAPKIAKANGIKDAEHIGHIKALSKCLMETPKAAKEIVDAISKGKGLATALGAGITTAGTEALTGDGSGTIDPPDIHGEKNDNTDVYKDLKEAAPQQLQQVAGAIANLSADETSGLSVASNTQGKGKSTEDSEQS